MSGVCRWRTRRCWSLSRNWRVNDAVRCAQDYVLLAAFFRPQLIFVEREIVMWKLRAVLLLGVLSLSGCLSEETVDTPLSGKESSLEGQWRLELAEVEVEEFDFSYTFSRDGFFANRVGGAFLKRIEELNTIDGIDIDTEQLDALDGGFLVLHGTWPANRDRLVQTWKDCRLTFSVRCRLSDGSQCRYTMNY